MEFTTKILIADENIEQRNFLKENLYRVFARGEFIPLYNAGNDVKMPFGYYTRIREVYEAGILTEEQIDTAAKHVFEYLMKIGEK